MQSLSSLLYVKVQLVEKVISFSFKQNKTTFCELIKRENEALFDDEKSEIWRKSQRIESFYPTSILKICFKRK